MSRELLLNRMLERESCLCVGLDPDRDKIPVHLSTTAEHPVLAFNRAIIQATAPYCIAYKLNTAFYEVMGADGWKILEQTLASIPDTHLKIIDAKRGDVGHTAEQYARTFFETLQADAVTVSPLLGKDSLEPFFAYSNKWTIVLGLTSNPGSRDFLQLPYQHSTWYAHIMQQVADWVSPDQLMFVVGATWPEQFKTLRTQFPEHFFLVPGVGAQGGELQVLLKHGFNSRAGILVNVSRAILYASSGEDFAAAAARQALTYARQMRDYLKIGA